MILTLTLSLSLDTQLHSFFLSFFSLAPTEANERQVQRQKQCQNNAKKSAKIALELREMKKAENDALVAQGICVDAALRPDVVKTIDMKVVRKIENIVDEDGKVYVFTSAERRIDAKSFASVTSRGNGTPLISDKNGGNVSAKIMKDIYKWECVKSIYTTTSAYNMNEVEKQVHKLLFENKMSIWLRNRAGGVRLDNPVRASVLPPHIHANCLTDETFLIYDDGILCFHPAALPEDRTSA
jgi:hypothetical protein